jgi:hypothetical protein
MTARMLAQDLLQRLFYAAPLAWRQDRIFRFAAIGAGVTGLLLVLRLMGPHDPTLRPSATDPGPTGVPTLSASGLAPSPALPPATVPKIAPGHALDDVIIAPALEGDRFGTAPPPSRK